MAVSGQQLVDYLKQFIGTPYTWGGDNPEDGFDCSGLMVYGANHFGLDLGGRTTYQQIGKGTAVSAKGLRVGDLIFFETNSSEAGPDHIAIYAGNGKMLHAPRPGKSVELVDFSPYWMDRFAGGRRIDGVVATGGNTTDFASPREAVKLTPEELAANYGFAIGFLESNPELKGLFKQAVADTWEPARFQAEVRNTDWWKTTADKARQAQALESSDPATWRAQLEATRLQVEQLANKLGASIPDDKLREIADTVARTGMDEAAISNVIGGYIQFTKDGTLKGEAGMHEYAIKQYAAQQGVKLDDDTIKQQAQLIAKKMGTPEDFKAQIREQAKSAYPGYSEQIDAGIKVKDLAAPYQNVMAKTFELPTDSITLDDPTIKSAMNGVNKDGKPTGLTLSQFSDVLRSDPRWRNTSNAQDQAMTAAVKVLNSMGLTAAPMSR